MGDARFIERIGLALKDSSKRLEVLVRHALRSTPGAPRPRCLNAVKCRHALSRAAVRLETRTGRGFQGDELRPSLFSQTETGAFQHARP